MTEGGPSPWRPSATEGIHLGNSRLRLPRPADRDRRHVGDHPVAGEPSSCPAGGTVHAYRGARAVGGRAARDLPRRGAHLARGRPVRDIRAGRDNRPAPLGRRDAAGRLRQGTGRAARWDADRGVGRSRPTGEGRAAQRGRVRHLPGRAAQGDQRRGPGSRRPAANRAARRTRRTASRARRRDREGRAADREQRGQAGGAAQHGSRWPGQAAHRQLRQAGADARHRRREAAGHAREAPGRNPSSSSASGSSRSTRALARCRRWRPVSAT